MFRFKLDLLKFDSKQVKFNLCLLRLEGGVWSRNLSSWYLAWFQVL